MVSFTLALRDRDREPVRVEIELGDEVLLLGPKQAFRMYRRIEGQALLRFASRSIGGKSFAQICFIETEGRVLEQLPFSFSLSVSYADLALGLVEEFGQVVPEFSHFAWRQSTLIQPLPWRRRLTACRPL